MTAAALRTWLGRAENSPAGLPDEGYADLLGADGPELDQLCVLADALRRDTVGEQLTFVANRNLDTGVAVADADLVDALVGEAWDLGATEICVQGPLPESAPDTGYLDLVARITARAPVHLHAFRPAEVADGAARLGRSPREFLTAAREAGLGSVPGTAARILDDRVRAELAGGPDLPVARWVDLITTAHEVGLRSTATMVYGHIENPTQQVDHLRLLAALQDRTGGFTEFIAMPQVPSALAAHLAGSARPGPTARETRAVHAVARLMLHGRIDHLQAAWTKLDPALTADVLRGGADDLGGLLLDGAVAPSAGAEQGHELSLADVEVLAAALGRTVRQRTTTYGDPPAERLAALRASRIP